MNLIGILLRRLILTLFTLYSVNGYCILPEFEFAYASINNQIDTDNGIFSGATGDHGAPVTSGGIVIEGFEYGTKSATLISSFGHSFASTAISASTFGNQSAQAILENTADSNLVSGSNFLEVDNVIRRGLLQDGGLDTLIGQDGIATYNEDDLKSAEADYRRILLIDPFNSNAVEGILESRMARVIKGNLVWDIKRKELFITRYIEMAEDVDGSILKLEIDLLEEMSLIEKDNIKLLLEVYSDPLLLGPGALLRGDFIIAGSEVAQSYNRLIMATSTRFAKSEQDLANKIMALNFFNVGDLNYPNSRTSAAELLKVSHAYISSVLSLLNSYITETTYDLSESDGLDTDLEALNTDALLQLTLNQSKMTELATLTQQGYNTFGFLPDFVPFIKADAHNSNLYTFNKMKGLADSARIEAEKKESFICGVPCKPNQGILGDIKSFAQSEAEYRSRMLDLEVSYQQRLRSLVGDVIIDGIIEADIYTFLFPDVDMDGDGISERDAARADLEIEKGFDFSSGNKGQIAEQYLVITNAELRVDDSYDRMNDLVKEMTAVESEARVLAGLDQSTAQHIFERILSDGSKVSILTKQKGILRQNAADKAARQRKRRSQRSAFINTAIAFVGVVAAPFTAGASLAVTAAAYAGSLAEMDNISRNMSSVSGSTAKAEGVIDARINDINTLQRADITVVEAAKHAQERLIKAQYSIYQLALKQNNLSLSYTMAQRDVDREYHVLSQKSSEVQNLLADLNRTITMLKLNNDSKELGWANVDIRDTLTDSILFADKSLFRAKVWAYIALRSLDYYANLPPQSNGQPDIKLLNLYKKLNFARRSSDIQAVLNEMDVLATSDFIFTLTTVSCPDTGLLSFKYDLFSTNKIIYDDDGNPINNSDTTAYEYYSFFDEILYEGSKAYQARFRDNIRNSISVVGGVRKLNLVFGTDLFPRPTSEFGQYASNPFYLQSAKTSKVIGFSNPNCSGQGMPTDQQGIQINITGNMFGGPRVELKQLGNSFLKHTAWENTDFDENRRLIDPLKNITVYSSYQQILPSWLIGDIDPASLEKEEKIGSDVTAILTALVNGAGSGNTKTLSFTDRSVANDMWVLEINELEHSDNEVFFDQLELMLNEPVSDSPMAEFLTDIQLRVGWNYSNPN
jgi:hypothetical protein